MIKTLVYPFALLLSWVYWLNGHIASKFLMLSDAHWWSEVFFYVYQKNMNWSSNTQDWVGGKGWMWPWGKAITFED